MRQIRTDSLFDSPWLQMAILSAGILFLLGRWSGGWDNFIIFIGTAPLWLMAVFKAFILVTSSSDSLIGTANEAVGLGDDSADD